MLEYRGIDFNRCKYRYKLHSIIVDLEQRNVLQSSSGEFESDSDNNKYYVLYADQSIDPDNEKALVNWFTGWSMLKLYKFKKFVVVGTGL